MALRKPLGHDNLVNILMERRVPLIEDEIMMINEQTKLMVDIMEHAMKPFLVMKSNWHDEIKWETNEVLIVYKEEYNDHPMKALPWPTYQ